MIKKIILLISFTLISFFLLINIKQEKLTNLLPLIKGKAKYSNKIGSLTIDKIHLHQILYSIDSKENQVDRAVTILYQDNQLIVLAAHSGNGINAFFQNLDHLDIKDKIKLELYQEKSTYLVSKIESIKKTGSIRFPQSSKETLILTTCGKNNDEQLLITAIKDYSQTKEVD